ncbi:MAG: thiamine pyrophosphate-binding protein [Pseudomonadota bacterium]
MNSADVIAERLYEAGVRFAFGIPGGEVLAFIDALERAGIRFVIARHENAAGFMAEGAYRASGAPAVLVATIGPGFANTVNVMANAEQDRVPLLVVSGKVAEAEALRFTHQVFDHAAVARPLVKATFEARENACDVMIEKALSLALSPRPGPVHIDLPIPVATADHRPPRIQRAAFPAAMAPAVGAALEKAQATVRAARRPLLVVGHDVLQQPGGAQRIADCAAAHRVPVVTTYRAKGVLSETDDLALGGHGLSPKSDAIVLPLVADADLILSAGYDPIEMRAGWTDPWDPAKVIEFVSAPNTHFVHGAALEFIGDAAASLDAVLGGESVTVDPAWAKRCRQARDDLAMAFAPPASGSTSDWGPAAALHVLNAHRAPDTVTTVDSGAHRILMSQLWTATAPNTLLQSTGLCTMGCALPLAIGHKLAAPTQPVMAVMGDGCLDMIMGELATLRDCRLPVTVVVLVDGSYALIELKQRNMGLQEAGVMFGRTDYAGVAEAVGLEGVTVRDAAALEAALKQAQSCDRSTVIAVEIGDRAYDGLI